MPPPAPQAQIEFLQKVQRLLTDGLFVASYKFALLRALADLAVLRGDDSGDELELSVGDIAAVFVELYWRQTRPFCAAGEPQGVILRQNTGKQAAVVQVVASAQAERGGSLAQLRHEKPRWDELVGQVAGTVAQMPLWKLQRVGAEVIDFLYPNVGTGRTIRLRPGVASCFRNFYGLLRNLIEGAWINYVRSLNVGVLGHASDIGAFLFGAERSTLEAFRPFLRDIQKDECFYCRQPLRQTGDVDHFIPWSRYPADLGHNLVLAHKRCNGDKCDHIAAEEHLSRWVERQSYHADGFRQFFDATRTTSDWKSSVSIARWAYSQVAVMQGLVWLHDRQLEHLSPKWLSLLAVA